MKTNVKLIGSLPIISLLSILLACLFYTTGFADNDKNYDSSSQNNNDAASNTEYIQKKEADTDDMHSKDSNTEDDKNANEDKENTKNDNSKINSEDTEDNKSDKANTEYTLTILSNGTGGGLLFDDELIVPEGSSVDIIERNREGEINVNTPDGELIQSLFYADNLSKIDGATPSHIDSVNADTTIYITFNQTDPLKPGYHYAVFRFDFNPIGNIPDGWIKNGDDVCLKQFPEGTALSDIETEWDNRYYYPIDTHDWYFNGWDLDSEEENLYRDTYWYEEAADCDPAEITGTVIDESTNKPIANVDLEYRDQSYQIRTAFGKTDQNGNFKIYVPSSVNGTWTISAHGYNTFEKELITYEEDSIENFSLSPCNFVHVTVDSEDEGHNNFHVWYTHDMELDREEDVVSLDRISYVDTTINVDSENVLVFSCFYMESNLIFEVDNVEPIAKDGYEFVGWQINGEDFTRVVVEKDKPLHIQAKYKKSVEPGPTPPGPTPEPTPTPSHDQGINHSGNNDANTSPNTADNNFYIIITLACVSLITAKWCLRKRNILKK